MTTAVMVVDAQNGVLAGIEESLAVRKVIAGLVARARHLGCPVVWVQHEDDDLPRDSEAWRLAPGFEPRPEDVVVTKSHRSAFAGTGLAHVLRARGVHEVVLTGAQSAFCVDAAGADALAEGLGVTLVSDGHVNGPMATDAGELTDAQVRALVNRTWSSRRHPAVGVRVAASADVELVGRPSRRSVSPDSVSPDGGLVVRSAQHGDVVEIVRLKAVLMQTGWPFPVDVTSDDAWAQRCAQAAHELLDDPRYGWFVVDAAGRQGLAGCCSVVVDQHLPGPAGTGRSAYLGDMVTDPRDQGRGIGRAMLGHALDWARAQGAGRAELHATASGRGLYESVGFRADGPFPYLGMSLAESRARAVGPESTNATLVGVRRT